MFVLAGDSAENASYVADFASNHGHRYARVESLIPATGVTLDQSALTLEVGATARLTATREPADANEPVIWKSDNEDVAIVDKNGLVAGVNYGTTNITATTRDGGFTATCTVTSPVHATGIKLNKSKATVAVGRTTTLKPVFTPADTTDQTVTWTSDNEAVATVSTKGVVTAVSEGTATITATAKDGGFTAQCVMTVHEAFGTPDFILPAGLTTIEANAFEGNAMTVVDAHTCTSIGAEAFKDCAGLEKIRLPKKCAIDPSAFSGCGDIQVYAPAGSTTESWCKKNGVQYIIY